MSRECPVTLIIPVFNVRDYIAELLQSIMEQTFTNFRVIIGDDGSTDGTRSVAAPYLQDPRFEYLEFETNRGLGAVMKDLLGRVTTRFWCNPGGDDRLHPQFLAQRLAAASEVANPILVHGTPRQINSAGCEIHHFPVFELPRHMPSTTFLEVLLYHNVVNNPGVMVSKAHTNICLGVMRSDLKYAPDWYWWILHTSLEGEVVFDPLPCMDYRFHAASLSGSPSKKWIRAEEVRRVPLLALYDAAAYSSIAASILQRYSRDLESLWVLRIVRVMLCSGGSMKLPAMPWLPKKGVARVLHLITTFMRAICSYCSRRLHPVGGDFVPSGYPLARHSSLRVRSKGL